MRASRQSLAGLALLAAGTLVTGAALPAGHGAPLWGSTALRGGAITTLAVDPMDGRLAYAGDARGHLFRTSDGGRTVRAAGASLGAPIRWIGIAHRVALFVLTDRGLYRRASAGGTYGRIGAGLPSSHRVHAVAIDPAASRVLYAGVTTGLLRSTDGGATFRALRLDRPGNAGADTDVWDIAADARVAGRLYAAAAAGLQVSNDGGYTWHLDDAPGSLARVVVAPPAAGGAIYLLSALGRTLLFSGDGLRDSFVQVDTPPGLLVRALATGARGRLYVGTQGRGVYVTADGGLTWHPTGNGLPAPTVLGFGQSTRAVSTLLYALTPAGVSRAEAH